MEHVTRYFHLMDDRRSRDRWHLGAPLDAVGEELDPWQFKHGRMLELGCVPRFPLDVRGRPLDYCWAAFTISVVHARVVELFNQLGVQDVQFIPVQVEGHEGPYFILNTLRTLRCIDDARSREVRYFTPEDEQPEKAGQYRVVSGMRIDPAQVGDAQIFRPWGWSVALIVSEELKDAMEAVGLTGTKFEEV